MRMDGMLLAILAVMGASQAVLLVILIAMGYDVLRMARRIADLEEQVEILIDRTESLGAVAEELWFRK
jgi:hypothetical protein